MILKLIIGKSGTVISGGDSQPAQQDQMSDRDRHDSRAESGQLRHGGVLSLTSQLLAGLLLLADLTPWPVRAQPDAAKPHLPSHRCLLIVETSKSMQRRAEAVREAVQDLLRSGLSGQLQDGDTLGMWTFNEDLHAGRFPLQTWSSKAQQEITERALTFLQAEKYEKQARFDKVVPALERVIKDSELITVILISSGEDRMQGTPFDGRINEYYQPWRPLLQKERLPFVTVLRAKNGQLADYVVNTPPWPLETPRLTPEMKRAEATQTGLPEAPRQTPSPAVPPLIISGKKPQAEQVTAPKPEPAVAKPEALPTVGVTTTTNEAVKAKLPEPAAPPVEAAKVEPAQEAPPTVGAATITNELVKAKPPEPAGPPVEAAKVEPAQEAPAPKSEPALAKPEAPPTVGVATTTNEPVKAKPPEPAAPPVEAAKVEPPPAVPEMPATVPVPTPAPAPTPVAQPKAETASAPVARPVEPAPARPETAPPPPVPAPKPEPATKEEPKPSPAPQVATVPAPIPSAAHEDAPNASTNSTTAQTAPSTPSPLAARPSSGSTLPVQNATAVPAGTLTSHQNIWIAGFVLAVVAAVSALLLIRRARATPQGSLITRSFEREKKP